MWQKSRQKGRIIMSNMSYCRFENTLPDLTDCFGSMDLIDDLSDNERRARLELIEICIEIAQYYGDEIK